MAERGLSGLPKARLERSGVLGGFVAGRLIGSGFAFERLRLPIAVELGLEVLPDQEVVEFVDLLNFRVDLEIAGFFFVFDAVQEVDPLEAALELDGYKVVVEP